MENGSDDGSGDEEQPLSLPKTDMLLLRRAEFWATVIADARCDCNGWMRGWVQCG